MKRMVIGFAFAATNLVIVLSLPARAQDVSAGVKAGAAAADKLVNYDGPLGAIIVGEALFILAMLYVGWRDRRDAAVDAKAAKAASDKELKEANEKASKDLKERNELMVDWIAKLANVVATNTVAVNNQTELILENQKTMTRANEATARLDAISERFVERLDDQPAPAPGRPGAKRS